MPGRRNALSRRRARVTRSMARLGCALSRPAPVRTLRVVTLGRSVHGDPAPRAGTGGFTLLELMVVIVVLGVLAGIILFGVGAFRSDARNSACRTDVRTLQTANGAYLAQHGSNAHDIAALISGGYIHSAPESGVTFADGVTNPASMSACTGELALTPDPPSSVPSGTPTVSVASASGSSFHPGHGDDFTATLHVTVTDQADVAVQGAVVAGSWSDGASVAGCTTAADGTCSFVSAHSTPTPAVDVTWSLTSVTKSGYGAAPGTTATVVCSRTGNPDDTRPCTTAVTV